MPGRAGSRIAPLWGDRLAGERRCRFCRASIKPACSCTLLTLGKIGGGRSSSRQSAPAWYNGNSLKIFWCGLFPEPGSHSFPARRSICRYLVTSVGGCFLFSAADCAGMTGAAVSASEKMPRHAVAAGRCAAYRSRGSHRMTWVAPSSACCSSLTRRQRTH
jgi:hypothetical protein